MGDWSTLLKPTAQLLVEALLDEPRSLSWLSQQTRLTKPSLLRHLRALEDIGLVTREDVRMPTGRETRYTLREGVFHVAVRPASGSILSWASVGPQDESLPLAAQIAGEDKRRDVVRALAAAMKAYGRRWKSDVRFVILFGSYARGEATWKSDIDLLLLLGPEPEEAWERLREALPAAQMAQDHPVRAHVSTVEDFVAGRRRIDQEAAEDGMVLFAAGEEAGVWRKLKRYRRFSI